MNRNEFRWHLRRLDLDDILELLWQPQSLSTDARELIISELRRRYSA